MVDKKDADQRKRADGMRESAAIVRKLTKAAKARQNTRREHMSQTACRILREATEH